MKIAIKSVKWTFHEIAAKQYFSNEQWIDILEEKDFETLLDDVASWKADYWVIEIENTITWTNYNYLNLLWSKDVAIQWELYMKVEKYLSALPWATLENIKVVCWEPTAIEMTRKFFEKYPKIKVVECWDLSIAWREIKEKNLTHVWLIWGKTAAKFYWFNILADKIDSDKKNFTRFFIIQSRNKEKNEVYNKASLHIMLPHQVWSLMQILWVIAAYWISLTKIESVPILGEPFHYSFFVDVAFTDMKRYQEMMSAIRPLIKELDIMWEYKAFDKPLSE